jgi:hypothetical protein
VWNIQPGVKTMIKTTVYSLAIATILALSAPASAGKISVQISFTGHEASIIRTFYRELDAQHKSKGKGKNKGKGKGPKGLPPGIAMNLQRGKALPPGIAKQALPTRLIDLLPPPPHGFERISLAGKILLVERATRKIHDVLEDAVLHR